MIKWTGVTAPAGVLLALLAVACSSSSSTHSGDGGVDAEHDTGKSTDAASSKQDASTSDAVSKTDSRETDAASKADSTETDAESKSDSKESDAVSKQDGEDKDAVSKHDAKERDAEPKHDATEKDATEKDVAPEPDAPATDAPATDAPATDAPATDAEADASEFNCPPSVPSGSCSTTTNPHSCWYGSDPRWFCRTEAVCSAGAWGVTEPLPGCSAQPVGCPAEVDAAAPSCATFTDECVYATEYCMCGFTGGPSSAWICEGAVPAGCPTLPPDTGDPCSTTVTCQYTNCSAEAQCVSGKWAWIPMAC